MAHASIDDLNRAAEEYFASLTDWEDQLAKPFSKPGEAPALLVEPRGVVARAAAFPGATVPRVRRRHRLAVRFLTQLGCRAILLDVSATALRMAEELYQPHAGDRRPSRSRSLWSSTAAPRLPDASVDRVVTFDAFHHVANPDDVLAEFGRSSQAGRHRRVRGAGREAFARADVPVRNADVWRGRERHRRSRDLADGRTVRRSAT